MRYWWFCLFYLFVCLEMSPGGIETSKLKEKISGSFFCQFRKFQFESSIVKSSSLLLIGHFHQWIKTILFTLFWQCSRPPSEGSACSNPPFPAQHHPGHPCSVGTMHSWIPSPLAVEGWGRYLWKAQVLEEKLLVREKARPSSLRVRLRIS